MCFLALGAKGTDLTPGHLHATYSQVAVFFVFCKSPKPYCALSHPQTPAQVRGKVAPFRGAKLACRRSWSRTLEADAGVTLFHFNQSAVLGWPLSHESCVKTSGLLLSLAFPIASFLVFHNWGFSGQTGRLYIPFHQVMKDLWFCFFSRSEDQGFVRYLLNDLYFVPCLVQFLLPECC